MEQQDDSNILRNRRRSLAANAALRRLSSHSDERGAEELLGETLVQPQENRFTDELVRKTYLREVR